MPEWCLTLYMFKTQLNSLPALHLPKQLFLFRLLYFITWNHYLFSLAKWCSPQRYVMKWGLGRTSFGKIEEKWRRRQQWENCPALSGATAREHIRATAHRPLIAIHPCTTWSHAKSSETFTLAECLVIEGWGLSIESSLHLVMALYQKNVSLCPETWTPNHIVPINNCLFLVFQYIGQGTLTPRGTVVVKKVKP